MLADLDLLLIAVYCTADDLLPKKPRNARRIVTDAEVVTLCVAQSMLGISSDQRFIATAVKRLGHLFPQLPDREGFYKRREALSDTIEALIAEFASHCPGSTDNVLLVDSTPVECARSCETVKRGGSSSLDDALSNAADYGFCASHSRYFTGSGCTRCSRWTALAREGCAAGELPSPRATSTHENWPQVCSRLAYAVDP